MGRWKWQEDEEEDVRSYWMTLRTGEDIPIWRRRLWIAPCRGIVLVEALDLSSDRILNEWSKTYLTISRKFIIQHIKCTLNKMKVNQSKFHNNISINWSETLCNSDTNGKLLWYYFTCWTNVLQMAYENVTDSDYILITNFCALIIIYS